MSYKANQYNYATPLNSATSLFSEDVAVTDKKYFTLFDNALDGSYSPIHGDVGLWGSSVADAEGNLPSPFVFIVEESLTINAVRLVSSQYCYPVDFVIRFYNNTSLIHTISVVDNSTHNYTGFLSSTITVTSYEVTITKISAPGVAIVYNSYVPGYVVRHDSLAVAAYSSSSASSLHDILRTDVILVASDNAPSQIVAHCAASDTATVAPAATGDTTVGIVSSDVIRERLTTATEVVNTMHNASDALLVSLPGASHIENTIEVAYDALSVKSVEHESHVVNNIDETTDVCPIGIKASIVADLANVHSVMKQPTRNIYGKVYITYTDPMLASDTQVTTSGAAYNSNVDQVLDSNASATDRLFTLYKNDLTGNYLAGDANSQVGWVSNQLSDENGEFGDNKPHLRIDFSERPVIGLQIMFDEVNGSIAVNFTVEYIKADGSVVSRSVANNEQALVALSDSVANVVSVRITVSKVSKPGYPVAILEVPTLSVRLYKGYRDESNLVSIDLLEELTYEDSIEALGGVSANVVTIKLDNSSKEFFFNNTESIVASSLKRNRKIVPWLGVEVTPGDIEWYTLGTFWSYKWDVPVESLVASVVGFDTLGLLDTTDFKQHTVQVNKSIGQLVEYILDDAKQLLDFIEYDIDASLYDVVIPYAWFEASSHTAALRKLSNCYPMHVYCNRDGIICAKLQKLHLDYYYDTWSDSTNVISKKYSSLYTTLPNIINVEVKSPSVTAGVKLVDDKLTFDVTKIRTRTLNFTSPYISGISVTVTRDATVNYTYEVYSWGIMINFTGTGNVTGISCVGTTLDINNSTTISSRDENSIRLNGAISRNIKSDFIQTSDLAVELIERLTSLAEHDKYDVEVVYRGDIALTINDPILLLDGIAPDNRYNIKRHELFWNGSLSGVAYLNT